MIIGITGSIGTGKTTVAGIFKSLGAYVIDADKLVHRILDAPLRKKIGRYVFKDSLALKRLCGILHPIVKREIALEIKKNRSRKVIVIDAPLLIEANVHKKCDSVIVVKASYQKQLERARGNLALSLKQVKERLKQQLPMREKIAMADFVIDNGGSLRNTEKQVKKIWKVLTLPDGRGKKTTIGKVK
ncbi:MAG: dephospho-CoA kinase [Omnitrophica WOR_2 bacterium GWC2_44_8]|nr:MAG: dephospho-CoA kinase [Omnitrophica WOR_2 bacterium GWC2_44_8]